MTIRIFNITRQQRFTKAINRLNVEVKLISKTVRSALNLLENDYELFMKIYEFDAQDCAVSFHACGEDKKWNIGKKVENRIENKVIKPSNLLTIIWKLFWMGKSLSRNFSYQPFFLHTIWHFLGNSSLSYTFLYIYSEDLLQYCTTNFFTWHAYKSTQLAWLTKTYTQTHYNPIHIRM